MTAWPAWPHHNSRAQPSCLLDSWLKLRSSSRIEAPSKQLHGSSIEARRSRPATATGLRGSRSDSLSRPRSAPTLQKKEAATGSRRSLTAARHRNALQAAEKLYSDQPPAVPRSPSPAKLRPSRSRLSTAAASPSRNKKTIPWGQCGGSNLAARSNRQRFRKQEPAGSQKPVLRTRKKTTPAPRSPGGQRHSGRASVGGGGSVAHGKWAARTFAELDQDGDGQLLPVEIRSGAFAQALGECFSGTVQESALNAIVDFVLRQADTDGDGYLTSDEFRAFTWKLRRMQFDADLEIDFVFDVFGGGDGTLNQQEIVELLAFHGMHDEEQATRIMTEIDTDNTGEITRREYRAWCKSRCHTLTQTRRLAHFDSAARAFAELDQDGDGHLAVCELRSGLFLEKLSECFGSTLPDDVLDALVDFVVSKADKDGDGHMSLAEFQSITWKLKRLEADVSLEEDFVQAVFGKRGVRKSVVLGLSKS